MKIFKHKFSDYLVFQKEFLILMILVWAIRLTLSLAHVPDAMAKWASLTLLTFPALVYYSIAAYTKGFGSYKQLLITLGIQNVLLTLLVVAGITIGILTNHDNIFTKPEFSGGFDGKTFAHIKGHLIALVPSILMTWLLGSLILFITKKVSRFLSKREMTKLSIQPDTPE
jgi:hypothetical protein